jgi:hypothetical protein
MTGGKGAAWFIVAEERRGPYAGTDGTGYKKML